MFRQRFGHEEVELASFRIRCGLAIPASVFVFNKPVAQFCKRLIVELLNLILYYLDGSRYVT